MSLLAEHLAQGVKRVIGFHKLELRVRGLRRISCNLLRVVTQRGKLGVIEIGMMGTDSRR